MSRPSRGRGRAQQLQQAIGRGNNYAAPGGATSSGVEGGFERLYLADGDQRKPPYGRGQHRHGQQQMHAQPHHNQFTDSPNADSHRGDSQRGDSQRGDSQRGDSQRGDSQRGDSQRGGSQRGGSQRSRTHQGSVPMPQQSQAQPAGLSGIELNSNYFSVDTQSNWIIHQYCITFQPEVVDKNLRRRLLYFHKEVIGKWKVFDGRMLYVPKQLDKQEQDLTYQLRDDSEGIINIKFSVELSPTSIQCNQIYNIIFRTMLHTMGMKEIGRNFYSPESCTPVPKYSLDILSGIATSIQPCMGGLKLVIDTSFKVLCQKTALQDLYEIYDEAQQKHVDFQKLCCERLPGKVVITRYNNRTYTIEEIDFDMTPDSKFETGDGKLVKYRDYMFQQYNLKVSDPKQPMLKTKATSKKSAVVLIPECCHLTGIPEHMQANHGIMRDLAEHTRLNPTNRHQALLKFIRSLNSHPQCSQDLKQWQIQIPNETMKLQAVVLKTENIYCADNFQTTYNKEKADWSRETRNKKFMVPKHFENWLFVTDQSSMHLVKDIMETLRRVCPGMGIRVDHPTQINVGPGQQGNYLRAIKDALQQGKPNFILCLFPTNRQDTYNAVKKLCCIDYGIPSQCMVARTYKRMQKNPMTYISKVAMLSSIKMGAELWHINIPLSLMVIGIDTYHDAAYKGRSVNAFVSSTNKNLSRYVSKVCFNHQYGELLDDITACMAGSLRAYQRENGELPTRILIYRDGVGDGQLKSVKEYELAQFYDACSRCGESYKPEITLVVCQKRVNARFSTRTHQGLGNPPPGTVISGDITRQDGDDFFLISQTVNQGTVGPTHYVVVHDKITALQNKQRLYSITYKLCHLYYNWLGTVQVPAPCQYAHKMAYMVGNSLHKEPHPDLYDKLFYL